MTEQTKTCSTCGQRLPLSAFYKHPNGKHGRLHRCKECHKAASRQNRREKIEKCRAYDRERAFQPHRVEARKKYQDRIKRDPVLRKRATDQNRCWSGRRAVQRHAQVMVGNAIKYGHLVTGDTCERCGSRTRIEAHHENYYRPLDVVWLCSSCHGLRHREINEEIRNGAVDLWRRRGFLGGYDK